MKLPLNIIRKGAGESGPVVLGRRWTAMQSATLRFLEGQGYEVKPLKNARYRLTKKGEKDRIVAIKTAADRWPNGSLDTLGDAEIVYIAAFYPRFKNYELDKPQRFQIAEVNAADYRKQAETVRANKDKLGQSGQVFMPLDEEQWKEGVNNIGCSAGYVLQHGKIVFDEPITWDGEAPVLNAQQTSGLPTGSSPLHISTYQAVIDEHRAQIQGALTKLGLPVAQVRIEVTLV